MSKIKINLASGNVVEKPLITCFKGTNWEYIVLDNEANGSMGLPIICISKFNGNSISKIIDQNEWLSVKENLKTIIGGTALPYLPVAEVLTAQDDFFTQLTLPLASFELLKREYKPILPEPVAPAVEEIISPVAPVQPIATPVIDPTPVSMPEIQMPLEPPVAVQPEIVTPVAPVVSEPVIKIDIQQPVQPMPLPIQHEMPQTPVVPTVPSPAPAQVKPLANDAEIKSIKETFMKSCETMFDALINKLQN